MGIWFLAYLTIPFRTGHVRVRVFDFNMKGQLALFLETFTTWVTSKLLNVMMNVINMLLKIVLFLETFFTNETFKGFHLNFIVGLTMSIQTRFGPETFATLFLVICYFSGVVYLLVMIQAGNTISTIITDVTLYRFMSNFFVRQ